MERQLTKLNTSRHYELFDAYTFTEQITVIGAGATGSWLVLALARLGLTNITVYDYDVIEEHNIPNQAYGIGDVGKYKVNALYDKVLEETGTKINIKCEKFVNQRLVGVVFLMVDTMSARKEIWNASIKLKQTVKLLIEPRMGLSLGRIYTIQPMDMSQIRGYEDTLYDDTETEVSACGASMTVISSALAITAICLRQLINWHNGEECCNEILSDFQYNNTITANFR